MKGLRRYLIVSAIFVIGYLLAQYYKPKPTDWTTSYLKEDKIPFGLYILYHQMGHLFPDTKITVSGLPVYNTLKDNDSNNSSYLLISGGLDLDKTGCGELLKFADRGNRVFIAAFDFGKFISDTLKLKTGSSFNFAKQKKTRVNFVNPQLKSTAGYTFNKGIGDQYFSKFDTSRVTVLGKDAEGHVNFIKYAIGKGALYILPNPQLLTNYNLLDPLGAEYAGKALSYLPASGTIIWDEYNTRGNTEDQSVLRVIFGHEPLRWAYELALIGLVIFVLFEMKRRQRIIPVIEPLKNSSVEFVELVGKVYYQQRDNRDIAQKKINYLLEHIRTNYHLKTTVIDQEFKTALALKSGAGDSAVNDLFKTINQATEGAGVNDTLLIDLNQKIELFYKQAK